MFKLDKISVCFLNKLHYVIYVKFQMVYLTTKRNLHLDSISADAQDS